MVLISILKHESIRTGIPPIKSNIQWSDDNQIAVIDRSGINVFSILADPSPEFEEEFSLERSRITVPSVPSIDTGYSADALFADSTREQVLEVLLDRILTPRGSQDFEFNNYYVKVAWSVNPVDTASPYYKPRCLLGALTSSSQLKIYDTKERQQYQHTPKVNRRNTNTGVENDDVDFHDGWVPIIDISREYHRALLRSWCETPNESVFDVYKARMYELTVVDFSWMEPWMCQGHQSSLLATFHGNGAMVIWKLVQNETKLEAEIIFTANFHKNHLVTCHRFFRVSDTVGIIAIGYETGFIKLYRIENRSNTVVEQGVKVESTVEEIDSPNSTSFWVGHEEELWENDELPVECIECVKQEETDGSTPSLTLVVVKHPNFVINFKVEVQDEKIVWEELNYLECPDGHIVGVSRYSRNIFFLGLDCGKLGMLELQDKSAFYSLIDKSFLDEVPSVSADDEENHDNQENEHDYSDGHRIHSDDPTYTNLWVYTGFALSPNGIIGCFCKTLSRTADSVVVKEFSACTFASLFPDENRWQHVQLAYKENDYSIPRTIDVLQAFKHYLRQHSNYKYSPYSPPKPVQVCGDRDELKLYLWVLKAIGIPKAGPTKKQAGITFHNTATIKLSMLKQLTLVQERILELYFKDVIHLLVEGDEDILTEEDANLYNRQSAAAIIDYLKSKPDYAQSNVKSAIASLQIQLDNRPICSSCDYEISFENNRDFKDGVTWPGILGYKWTGQTCPSQHPNIVSVLSLVPLDFPNRECPWCGCGAAILPAFGQPPLCPFCDEFMRCEPQLSDFVEHMDISMEESTPTLELPTEYPGLSIEIEFQ